MSSAPSVWGALSQSCRRAFEWALALDPDESRAGVYSENLLLGLAEVHKTSGEPKVLLRYFGLSDGDLEEAVARVSGHHRREPGSLQTLESAPRMSRNTDQALRAAADLAGQGRWQDKEVHAPHLFGGLLTQSQSYAYRALDALLGQRFDFAGFARRYVEEYVLAGPDESLERFLSDFARSGQSEPISSQAPNPPPSESVVEAPRESRREKVNWVADAVASEDLLKRRTLATVLADRLEQIDTAKERKSFLLHIDGQWGSGKSTLLEFLRAELEAKQWLIVEFDAWRQSRVGPPWWSLLSSLRHALAARMTWWQRSWLRIRETGHRLRRGGAPYILSLVLLFVAAGGLFFLLRPQTLSAGDIKTVAEAVAAVVATLATLWAGARVISRFLLWDSAVGARLFEQSQQNPMESLAAHFSWLVRCTKTPIAFFIDDLDRCSETYVVDLLESVQTLVRDAGEYDTRTPPNTTYFIVAADGAWLRRCYETAYKTFEGAVGQPGRTLGYLFLDKIFQLTVPVPWVNAAAQLEYIRGLLGVAGSHQDDAGAKGDVERQIDNSTTRDEGVRALENAPEAVKRDLAPVLVKKLNSKEVSASTEHSLTRFATLLEPNPRAMKRFLNAFSIADSVLVLQHVFVSYEELALWTILRLRWPALGDYLRRRPDEIAKLGAEATADIPADLAPLFKAEEVLKVVNHQDGGPLTAESVRKCSGILVDDRLLEATILEPSKSPVAGPTPNAAAPATPGARPAP